MSDYDYDSMTNNLRDSANGTFVTLDDSSHFTDSVDELIFVIYSWYFNAEF